MAIDLTADPKQILLDGINLRNASRLPRPITLTEAVFSDPQSYGSPENDSNTSIRFGTTVPEVFGIGTSEIKYTRIDVQATIASQQPALAEGSAAVNVSDLLAGLNATYNIYLQASDIVDRPIDFSGPIPTATINVKPTSMMYAGNVVLSLGDQADLSKSLTVSDLNGLTGFRVPSTDLRPAPTTDWSDTATTQVALVRAGAFTLHKADLTTTDMVGYVDLDTTPLEPGSTVTGDTGSLESTLPDGLTLLIMYTPTADTYILGVTITYSGSPVGIFNNRAARLVDVTGQTVWSGRTATNGVPDLTPVTVALASGQYALEILPIDGHEGDLPIGGGVGGGAA